MLKLLVMAVMLGMVGCAEPDSCGSRPPRPAFSVFYTQDGRIAQMDADEFAALHAWSLKMAEWADCVAY